MVISKKNCTPACNIVMNGTVLKHVHKFNYLGSLITSDIRCINEIKRRMAQAKASFQNMNKNKNKKFIVDPNTNSYIIQIHQINQ